MEWTVAAVLIVFMLCRLATHAIDRLKPDSSTDAIGFHHDFLRGDDD